MKTRDDKNKDQKITGAANSPHFQQEGIGSAMPPKQLFSEQEEEQGKEEIQLKEEKGFADSGGAIPPYDPNNPRQENILSVLQRRHKEATKGEEPKQYKRFEPKNLAARQFRQVTPFQFSDSVAYQNSLQPETGSQNDQAQAVQAKGVVQKQDQGSPTEIPDGGKNVGKAGIVNWNKEPKLKLRSSQSTSSEVVGELSFNTKLQIVKEFDNGWYFVSLANGNMGYVSKSYVWSHLPEPNATLHKVEGGEKGTAIAIAEHYYKERVVWGQDLRYYVNALAQVNNLAVPDRRDGWESVAFQADDLIWIPSVSFAKGLADVLQSGSVSHDMADKIGVGDFLQSADQKRRDFGKAISQCGKYLPEALASHALDGLVNALVSIGMLILGAAAIMAITTGIGALIGNAPGAAAGAKVGLFIIKWLGIAMLIAWVGSAIHRIGLAFGTFVSTIWNANGDPAAIDKGAKDLAEALGVTLEIIIEAIVIFVAAKGMQLGVGRLANSKFGKRIGVEKLMNFLKGKKPKERRGTVQFSKKVNQQKMQRHLKDTAPPNKSYFESIQEAQGVLDAYNAGNYRFISEVPSQNTVTIEVVSITGRYVNTGNPNGLPDLNLPTNKFMIQSSKSPKVVPVNPNK